VIVQQAIEQKLDANFDPEFLSVENESHMHSGTAPETHFKVTLASETFNGMRKVARHQKVYGLLADELAGTVHALALHLYTPDEWAERERSPDSPNCMGGSGNS
jgi:BolA protein